MLVPDPTPSLVEMPTAIVVKSLVRMTLAGCRLMLRWVPPIQEGGLHLFQNW
jgi:hypothetical protein